MYTFRRMGIIHTKIHKTDVLIIG